jgi:hypothetical protein
MSSVHDDKNACFICQQPTYEGEPISNFICTGFALIGLTMMFWGLIMFAPLGYMGRLICFAGGGGSVVLGFLVGFIGYSCFHHKP